MEIFADLFTSVGGNLTDRSIQRLVESLLPIQGSGPIKGFEALANGRPFLSHLGQNVFGQRRQILVGEHGSAFVPFHVPSTTEILLQELSSLMPVC
jgi:hypothetical protein